MLGRVGKVKAVMKKINEVSRLAGVSRRTLQYYDDEGLLIVERSKDNYRLYDEAALERLWRILVYREMEFELKEIKNLLILPDDDQKKCLEQRMRVIAQHLNDQIGFISFVHNHGMPPVPRDNTGVSMTYREQILDLRKQWKTG
jgi:DNA-binding transcriptional MerR regulator